MLANILGMQLAYETDIFTHCGEGWVGGGSNPCAEYHVVDVTLCSVKNDESLNLVDTLH